MKGDGIDREHHIPASFALPVTLEGILSCLALLTVVKVLHGYSALYRAEGIASVVRVAAYTACLILQGRLPYLLWLPSLDAAVCTPKLVWYHSSMLLAIR